MPPVGVRRTSRAAAAAVALGALLILTGCGQRSEPTGAAVPLYPITVSQPSGAPIVVKKQPRKVVALTPQAASILSSLVGHTVEPQRSPGDADLVVTTPESLSPRTPGVYIAPDDSVDDVERALTELGLLIDKPIRARDLVADIRAKRKLVHDHLQGVKPVTVYVDTGFFITVSTNTYLGDLITEAGGTNVAGPVPQAGPFSLNKLLQIDPDYYLATSDSGTKLADLRRDPRTRRLKAVRDGHFAVLGAKVTEPGGETGSELLAVARYLHPDAFR
jgi:ABC-type Fe3+-hydroxamate transport system substrate-binding protein